MKVLFVHNSYSDITPSGEEHASQELANLLETHGHKVAWYRRSSDEIRRGFGPVKSFFTGIYNPASAKALAKVLDEFKPDVVQVQNLYPLLSSSIFKPIKQRRIPVVMRCPNYRLFCPAGLCLNPKGMVCEKCFGGREWNCVLNNCEKTFFKSIGYAIRNWYSRASHNISNGVDAFIVQSEFQKQKFIVQGINQNKICIVPGIAPDVEIPVEWQAGEFVSFVGRVSIEKGIDEFIEAARQNPNMPFKVAGNVDSSYYIPDNLPPNIEFVGFLKGKDLNDFYLKSRIIVVPSKWYEGFPNVIVRGMLLGRPIVTTNIGAMQSIIDNEKNGILVPPADSRLLGEAIFRLYNNINLCKKLGIQAMKDTNDKYSRERIYEILISIYKRVLNA